MYFNNFIYENEVITIATNEIINWDIFCEKNILISGATGLIGTFLIDILMYRNNKYNNNINIYAISRNLDKINNRFSDYLNSPFFKILNNDVQNPIEIKTNIDYIIHGASNAHPIAYSTQPIDTILTTVIGTKNILDLAYKNKVIKTVLISTTEIYGENRGDIEFFKEDYCGYINCNTLRAGYPESKRTAEALCQAYIKEKKLEIVIARCGRIFGPTMSIDDSKAIAQFIKKIVSNKDIVLKSDGKRKYSYCYVADTCSALLLLLLKGKNGEAYNISNPDSKLSLLEIATILADYTNKKIIYDIPSQSEAEGFSVVSKSLLDSSKLSMLGWRPINTIEEALKKTIDIMVNK